MKDYFKRNYQLLSIIIGFILYLLFKSVIAYVFVILIGVVVFWGKTTEKIDLYNFDMLIYILYTIFSIISLFLWKDNISNMLVITLGLNIIFYYVANNKINI